MDGFWNKSFLFGRSEFEHLREDDVDIAGERGTRLEFVGGFESEKALVPMAHLGTPLMIRLRSFVTQIVFEE